MLVMTWMLVLSLNFTGEKEWKGDAYIPMQFSNEELCKSFRRAIWSQLKNAKGELGECVPIPIQSITVPKIDK